MPNTRALRNRRLALMIEDPHCWYCGVEVHYTYPPRDTRPCSNLATIEHRFNRYHLDRGCGQDDTVLACYQCNHDVGRWADILHAEADEFVDAE